MFISGLTSLVMELDFSCSHLMLTSHKSTVDELTVNTSMTTEQFPSADDHKVIWFKVLETKNRKEVMGSIHSLYKLGAVE